MQPRSASLRALVVVAAFCQFPAVADQIRDILNQASLPEYQSYLRVLTGVDPIPGNPPAYLQNRYTFGSDIWLAAQWMQDRFSGFGLNASLDTWYPWYGPNVVAEWPGVRHPENIIVLTSHYDTYCEQGQWVAPGCDDNGSGTAGALMAARILSQSRFDATIRFISFSGEEQWLLGSDAYVQRARQAGENIVAAINWDMILHPRFDRAPATPQALHIERDPAGSSDWLAQYMAGQIATYTSLPTQTVTDPYGAGDHASFWKYGYSAIDLVEHDAAEIWWGGSNAEYHQITDDFDNPHLDWQFGLEAVRAGMAGAIGLAGLVPEPNTALALLTLVALLRPRTAPLRARASRSL